MDKELASNWDYGKEVKEVRGNIGMMDGIKLEMDGLKIRCKDLGMDTLKRLWIAREILSQNRHKDISKLTKLTFVTNVTNVKNVTKKTWKGFCEDCGINRETIHRRLEEYESEVLKIRDDLLLVALLEAPQEEEEPVEEEKEEEEEMTEEEKELKEEEEDLEEKIEKEKKKSEVRAKKKELKKLKEAPYVDANALLREMGDDIINMNALLKEIFEVWKNLDEGEKIRFSTALCRLSEIIKTKMKNTDLKMLKNFSSEGAGGSK